MLKTTFRHLDGIGEKRERNLWSAGIVSWSDFESITNGYEQLPLWAEKHSPRGLDASRQALKEQDATFFAEGLRRREYYRIAPALAEKTLFLDIETTGLSKFYHHITVVGWSLNGEYGIHIRGDDDTELREVLKNAEIIVTFNGSLFDIPFLEKEFPSIKIPAVHIDLRFLARRIGLSGGQKNIESVLGLTRAETIGDMDGRHAPLLWYRYCWGEREALRNLIEYNHADIVGMHVILDTVIERIIETEEIPIEPESVFHFSDQDCELRIADREDCSSQRAIMVRPYRGDPMLSLQDLSNSYDLRASRFVGIDLTGSEDRASGWCLLEGDIAHTKMISADSDLIENCLLAEPLLVSIDSPLSLPAGRKSVNDDDPGREVYGIMRRCERTLKQRGVNVYPCLINSMQQLTARGIRLASELRRKGIPVIESFPGAAQDILRMPRKGTSLRLLKRSLGEFGIAGDYVSESVTHDELDAITCAIVACFFWAGRFEALGDEEEEFLIVPDPSVMESRWKQRTVFGLSGPISTGKTTAGKILENWGFHYTRFGLVLKEILDEVGLEPTRDNLQEIGADIHRDPGQRWLCWQLVSAIPQSDNVVIDGLRHPEDHSFMVERYGPAFVHMYIDSPVKDRLQRYVDDSGTERGFRQASQHPVEANVTKLKQLAHLIVSNSRTLNEFHQTVYEIISNYIQEEKDQCQ